MVTTYTWNGGSASATDPSQWTPNGIPGPFDTAIVTAGDVIFPSDTQLNGTTVQVGSATLSFVGDNSLDYNNPTLDQSSVITSQVATVVTAEATVFDSSGIFVNRGAIDANGPAGSSFAINITKNGTMRAISTTMAPLK